MELPRTRELLPKLLWRESSPSTNAELREAANDAALPHGTMLATDEQTAGRGRLARGWVTPPGQALAISVLIRGYGENGAGGWGGLGPAWLPLIAGSAVQASLQPLFTAAAETAAAADPDGGHEALRVGTKWPNDVHVRNEEDAIAGSPGKKLCGILCELLPDGSAIVGMGVNVLIPEWELPTDRASSLLAAGAELGLGAEGSEGIPETFEAEGGAELADRLLSSIGVELLRLCELAASDAALVRAGAARNSLTLGTEVRAHLPGGGLVDGFARELAGDGSLVIDRATGGRLVVSAGDVQHLR